MRARLRPLTHWPGMQGVRLGPKSKLAMLVALTALVLPLATWGWSWVGAILAPSAAIPANQPPVPPPTRRPSQGAPNADLEHGPAAVASAARPPQGPGAIDRLPDPFEGAAEDAVSLKLLERKLKIRETELKLAQIERQIRELREGAGATPPARPSGLAGPPSVPPALRGLPPVPPLGEASSPAPRQAGAPPPASASAPAPAPPTQSAPVWPVVRLVALGPDPFALVEIGGNVAQVSRGDQLGDVVVESVDLNGVSFRHLSSDQRHFALISGEASAKPTKAP